MHRAKARKWPSAMKDRIAGWPRRWRHGAELAETRSVVAQAAVEPAEPLWAVVD